LASLPWNGGTIVEIRLVDNTHALDSLGEQLLDVSDLTLNLPPPFVALVTLRPQKPE
jgi:hypothetical protein